MMEVTMNVKDCVKLLEDNNYSEESVATVFFNFTTLTTNRLNRCKNKNFENTVIAIDEIQDRWRSLCNKTSDKMNVGGFQSIMFKELEKEIPGITQFYLLKTRHQYLREYLK